VKPAIRRFPHTRLYTVDTCAIAKGKHHIGAPMARFTARLTGLLESAWGLAAEEPPRE
jgi:hypothetical protein